MSKEVPMQINEAETLFVIVECDINLGNILPQQKKIHVPFSEEVPLDIMVRSFINLSSMFFPLSEKSWSGLKNNFDDYADIINMNVIMDAIEKNTLHKEVAIKLWIIMFLFLESACSVEYNERLSLLLTPEWGCQL